MCRGPVRTNKFRVQSAGPSGEHIQGEDYKRLFLAQKDFAMQELCRQNRSDSAEGGGAPESGDGHSTEESSAATSSFETCSAASVSFSREAIDDELLINSDAESSTDFSSLLSM